MNNKIKFLIGLILFSSSAFAQFQIFGKVLDEESKKPVPRVNISLEKGLEGVASSEIGSFTLTTDKQRVNILFSSVGYKTKLLNLKLNGKNLDIGIVFMEPAPYDLEEITINAGLNKIGEIPLTITEISAKTITKNLGDRPLPLIMGSNPGIFSVRDGGGSGDADLSIRGFHQESVALLLNGIPINGEENGLVYWSNWLGLSSAAAEIQIQKGPGLANASVNAIGGTVNIITRNANTQKSGSINFSISSYGNLNTSIVLNSGQLNNGWNVSFMAGFGSGPGYIDATYVKSWSYFFSALKRINQKHSISINLIGAPQEHGQKTIKLSEEEVGVHGNKFNKDWGNLNGQQKNASLNFYHKPFFTFKHEYKISKLSILSTTAYFSAGYGGGRWSESFNYSPSIFYYRTFSGQIDWESIYENNATHEGNYTLENGETVSGYSMNVQTNFLASHIQTGLISNFEYKINERLKFKTGIHFRYFNSFLREEIKDLLGGNFFIENYAWSLAGVAGRDQIKTIGDIIRVDNNSKIFFANTYAQLTYNSRKINSYLSANISNNWYQRIDRFNYIDNTKSEIVIKPGFDIRAGITYKPLIGNNIYLNAAYISRAPYFKYVFGNFTNVVVKDLKNETVKIIEIGYKLKKPIINFNLSAYYTIRGNVSFLSNEYVQLEDNTQTRSMINGLNSIHKGIESELQFNIRRNFKLGGWLSLGDFKWQNDVSASLINDYNVVVDTINVYAKGLFIGGTAQQQFGAFTEFSLLRTFNIRFEWLYYNHLYSHFDPTQRQDPDDRAQAYQLPDYGIANIFVGIPFTVGDNFGNLQINAYNLFNKSYIVKGEDGINHDIETFRGFWSFSRNITFSVKFNF